MAHFTIAETATGKQEHTIPVRGKSQTQIYRIESGLLRNLNTDKYHVDFVPDGQRSTSKTDRQ